MRAPPGARISLALRPARQPLASPAAHARSLAVLCRSSARRSQIGTRPLAVLICRRTGLRAARLRARRRRRRRRRSRRSPGRIRSARRPAHLCPRRALPAGSLSGASTRARSCLRCSSTTSASRSSRSTRSSAARERRRRRPVRRPRSQDRPASRSRAMCVSRCALAGCPLQPSPSRPAVALCGSSSQASPCAACRLTDHEARAPDR